MIKRAIDVTTLLDRQDLRVADLVAELEASRESKATTSRWPEMLPASTRGGKDRG